MSVWEFPSTGTAQVTLQLNDDGYIIDAGSSDSASSEKNLNISNIETPKQMDDTNDYHTTLRRILYIFGIVTEETEETFTINYTIKVSDQDIEPAGN